MWEKLQKEKKMEGNYVIYFNKKEVEPSRGIGSSMVFVISQKKGSKGALLAFLSLTDTEEGSFMKENVSS